MFIDMKKILLLLPLFAIVFLSGCTQSETEETSSAPVSEEVVENVVPTEKPMIPEEKSVDLLTFVSSHSGADSCYTVISGAAYDLTSRIGKHPGGDKAILASCGKDSTGKFDGQHGMDPKKWEWLKQFEIKM